jgi:antitoxin ParD1/3/4
LFAGSLVAISFLQCHAFAMNVTLTKELEQLVESRVRSGRYADASDVMRAALRALESQTEYESPALEAALLEGVRSKHRPYGPAVIARVRRAAKSL